MSRSFHSRLLVAAAALLATVTWTGAASAVVNGAPVPEGDRRFDAVGLLLTAGSHVCGGFISGSCTLVSPNTVLLAKHSVQRSNLSMPPMDGHTHRVRFRRSLGGTVSNRYYGDPSLDCHDNYQEIWIREFRTCPQFGVDMVLGVLEVAPTGITPMALDVSGGPSPNDPFLISGWGFDGACFGQGQAWTLRSATGRIPINTPMDSVFSYNTASIVGGCFTTGNGNTAIGNLHDSGAPILKEVHVPGGGTELRQVGMVVGIGTAHRLTAWNLAGGEPQLSSTTSTTPPPVGCRADMDGNGVLGEDDIYMFIRLFLAGDARAEFNGTPGIAFGDLMSFLEAYISGC